MFRSVIIQILLLDIVFSFDSIITAVGMVDNLLVIILAVVLSFGVMLFAAKYIFAFVNRHPTVKMLALSFLVMIGAFLIADGFDVHVSKGADLRPDRVRDRRRGAQSHLQEAPGVQGRSGDPTGAPAPT